MRKKRIALIIVVVFGLCAWSPWITQNSALRLAETQFNKAWSGIIDGCGSFGNDVGAKDFQKIPFGATLTLEYQCGLVMPGATPMQTEVYVSFLGIAFGYPAP